MPRRYVAVIQDPRGYPPPRVLEEAPPVGPAPPVIHSVVLVDDYNKLVDAARIALSYLSYQGPAAYTKDEAIEALHAALEEPNAEAEAAALEGHHGPGGPT